MTSRRAHIISVGARTPLGLAAAYSAAAVRAGLDGIAEHPFMVAPDGEPLVCVADKRLAPTLFGPRRVAALAAHALEEVCLDLATKNRPVKAEVVLGLPEPRPGWDARATSSVFAELQAVRFSYPIERFRLLERGHAAGLAAMREARDAIVEGRSDLVIVGGADSYLEADTIDWLAAAGRLHREGARSAFIPGEGAGFCALASDRLTSAWEVRPPAAVVAAGSAIEPASILSDDICLGQGLTEAVGRALEEMNTEAPHIDAVICDINGERYRSEEWGFVALRHGVAFADPAGYQAPAFHWGDVGAASGPLYATLAVGAARRGYAEGTHYMLWAGSNNGDREAVVLEIDEGQGRGFVL